MSTKLELNIEGMTCGSCSKSITARLSKFEFASDVLVDWENGTGTLTVDGDFDENRAKIVTAINQIGYKVVE